MASCVNVLPEWRAFSCGDLGVNGEGGTRKSGRMRQCKHSVVTHRRVLNKWHAICFVCRCPRKHLRTKFSYFSGKMLLFTQSNSSQEFCFHGVWIYSTSFIPGQMCRSQRKNWTRDSKPQPMMMLIMTLHFHTLSSLSSRWEDDWWCFSKNYWSLTSLQLSALPLQRVWTTIISHQAPGSFAHSAQWPLHCGGVQCFTASCSSLFAFTVHKVSYHGAVWQKVALMWFWSTFQEATYYSAYECVEFISTHCCGHTKDVKSCYVARLPSSSSVVLPLEFEKGISNAFCWTHWIFLATRGHFHWHISSLPEQRSNCVSDSFL